MTPADRWRFSAAAVLILAFLIPGWLALHDSWVNSYTYSHGYLVLAVSVWLAYSEFRRGGPWFSATSGWGVAALACSLLFAIAATAGAIRLLQQVSVPLVIGSALWAFGGWNIVRRFSPAALFLLFGVSWWDAINEPLRAMTTNVVALLTRWSGIPAFIEGNRIYVPSGTFEVAGGCSGLSYFIVACALATYYGILHFRSAAARVVLVIAAGAAALVANWTRVWSLVLVGNASEMQHYLVTVDHYYYGWVLFVLFMLPLVPLARRLERMTDARPRRLEGVSDASVGIRREHWGAVALVMLAAGLLLHARVSGIGAGSAEPQWMLPSVSGWQRSESWQGPGRPVFVGAVIEEASYAAASDNVQALLAYFPRQVQGRELIYYANSVVGSGATVISRRERSVPIGRGQEMAFAELRVTDAMGVDRIVLLAMRVGDWPVVTDVGAKLAQVLAAFLGRHDANALVLSSACAGDCADAEAALLRFATGFNVDRFACANQTQAEKLDDDDPERPCGRAADVR